MNMKKILLLGFVTVIGMDAPHAFANNIFATPVPASLYHQNYKNSLNESQKQALQGYMDYEFREPCQNYRAVPNGFYRDGCTLRYNYPEAKSNQYASNVIIAYEINFAYDSARIELGANTTLNQITNDLNKYNPREVIVAGFTDKAGSPDYNISLSERRANSVSDALGTRGVATRKIDLQAFGEGYPAVNTKDGVPLRANRRVVVEFRK